MTPSFKDLFLRVDAMGRTLGRVAETAVPRGSMALDDELTFPINMSHTLRAYLMIAVDNLRLVRRGLIDHDGEIVVPIIAPYVNLRSVIESCALADWIMVPDDRKVRLTRLLRARTDDFAQDKNAFLAMTDLSRESDPTQRKVLARMRQKIGADARRSNDWVASIVQKAGLDRVECSRPLPGWREIIDSSQKEGGQPDPNTAALWSAISGLAHPSASRFLTFTDQVDATPAGGEAFDVKVVGRPKELAQMIELTLLIWDGTLALFRRRKLAPG